MHVSNKISLTQLTHTLVVTLYLTFFTSLERAGTHRLPSILGEWSLARKARNNGKVSFPCYVNLFSCQLHRYLSFIQFSYRSSNSFNLPDEYAYPFTNGSQSTDQNSMGNGQDNANKGTMYSFPTQFGQPFSGDSSFESQFTYSAAVDAPSSYGNIALNVDYTPSRQPAEDSRLKNKRERNRKSAAKSRARKVLREIALEYRVKDLTAIDEEKTAQIEKQRAQIKELHTKNIELRERERQGLARQLNSQPDSYQQTQEPRRVKRRHSI